MKRQKTTQTKAITNFDEIEHVKIRNLNYLSSETCFGGINENAG